MNIIEEKKMTKRKRYAILISLGLVGVFLAPVTTLAAGWGGLNIPYWGAGGLVACNGDVCSNLCQITELADHLIRFGFTILLFVIAPIMIVAGGGMILIAGASETLLSKGKMILKGAVVGVVLALLAYVIVTTFLWLIGNKVGGEGINWPVVQCSVGEAPGNTPLGNPAGGVVVPGLSDHEAILKQLNDAGISVVSSGGCSDPNNSSCTSLSGLPPTAITGLKYINLVCNCDLVVTGGTEVGHRTHGSGKSIVDIQNNASTNKYVYSQIGTSNLRMNTWYLGKDDGVHYYYEGDHWHVCFDLGDCPHVVPGE